MCKAREKYSHSTCQIHQTASSNRRPPSETEPSKNRDKPYLRTAHKIIYFIYLLVSFKIWAWKSFCTLLSPTIYRTWAETAELTAVMSLALMECFVPQRVRMPPGSEQELRDARCVCCKMADAPFNYTSHRRLMQRIQTLFKNTGTSYCISAV